MSRGLAHHQPPPPSTPAKVAPVYRDDERDMLESLKGLSIKNFHDWYFILPSFFPTILMRCSSNDNGMGCNTPSSNNTSLPTPPALRSSQVYLVTEEQPMLSSNWCPPPNAPLLKDVDSFTDFTGHSSFDFPLPNNAGADDAPATKLPLLFHHPENVDDALDIDSDLISPSETVYPNSLALDLLPCTEDPALSVLAWIEGVSATQEEQTTPKKRRRSLTASSEVEARRVRAWTPTVEPSHAPQPSPRRGGCPTERQEPEAPD
ncbi:hypothetical protein CPB83DRAFT_568613 [Crepidotus variabilis]|uniref:Uncharacterized protein n=1 Tax=Crepidotus variabilis TaxID=179855 RepID=A0A9P6E990_9AGAR|nr:hypothetical protein CPB83DRAFT_568613 [Crepidotus variabilis]